MTQRMTAAQFREYARTLRKSKSAKAQPPKNLRGYKFKRGEYIRVYLTPEDVLP